MKTTRKGFRKSLVAKKYQQSLSKKTGVTITLRQARKETGVIESILKILKPLSDKNRLKVVRVVKILADIE